MDRLSHRNLTDFTSDQRALYDTLAQSRKPQKEGRLGGPFDSWLMNPELGKRVIGLGNMFRFRTEAARRYVEIVILTTGHFWQAQFEWFAHEPMARDAGVPQSVIDAIKAGETPVSDDDGDVIAWRLADELHTHHRVSSATFKAAVTVFGEVGVAELVNLAGYYTMVSMTLNTFEVPLPEGAEYPFDNWYEN